MGGNKDKDKDEVAIEQPVAKGGVDDGVSIPSTLGPNPEGALQAQAAAAAGIVAGGPSLRGELLKNSFQNVMYKLITFQGWLIRFADTQVRGAFLVGYFEVVNNTKEMLMSLDAIRQMVLPIPTGEAQTELPSPTLAGVVFLTKLFAHVDEEPIDTDGNPFPVGMTYPNWEIYLGQLSASPYWNRPSKSQSVRPKTGPPKQKKQPVADLEGELFATANFEDLGKTSPSSGAWHCDASGWRFHPQSKPSKEDRDLSERLKKLSAYSTPAKRSLKYEPDSNSDSDSSEGSPDQKHYPNSHIPLSQPRSSRKPGSDNASGCENMGEQWLNILSQLRQPKEPVPPRVFDGKDGTHIKDFLTEYEAYFAAKYFGNDRQEAQLLVQYLEGSPRKAYEALDGSRIRYSVLKPLLISWYKGERISLRNKRENEFRKAKMSQNESLKIYAMRLERLAAEAFPNSVQDCERKLCRKFRKTVPDSFQQALRTSQRSLPLHSGKIKLTWRDMCLLAESEDRVVRERKEEQSSDTDVDRDLSVWYSRSQAKESGKKATKSKKVSFGRTSQKPKKTSGEGASPTGGSSQDDKPPTTTQRRYNIPQCNWCGRRGHTEEGCWAKKGACIICGSSSHNRDGCPHFESSWRNFRPTCSKCSGPHLGRDCDSENP